jgi:cyclic beta-1,2-glucan synthetase
VASLYEHGARAIDRSVASLARGPHGLPPIGTGDWNDGMNRVGAEGRGESVWLGWFLCTVIDAFLPLAERRGEGSSGGGQQERARQWREARAGLALALERDGWDGHWYRRAYFDDGTPLGSASGVECRIDLIAQAWAVLSRVGERGRAAEAMASAGQLLWDPAAGLMRLLDPPLAKAEPDAGYIQAYPPGIRENGGQYSHGAVWALMAYAQEGDGAWAWRVFEALSPAHRTLHPERGAVYALEPYVVAGDICSQPPYAGRGGWSWYTGAASWLQRAAVESICGLVIEGRLLTVSPCLPPHWPGVELTVRRQGRVCQVAVVRGEEAATRSASALVRPIAAGEAVDLTNLPDGITLLLTIALETPTSRFDAGAVVA